jgi:DivIVA domain-containing protein
MARSRVHDRESAKAADEGVQDVAETKAAETEAAKVTEGDRVARRLPASLVSVSERERMVAEARAVRFPVGLRGYERAAVDRYVEQVNRLIAELEISSSPESAVRHALHEVSEETRELLQGAHQTADEITARSRAKADDRLQQAKREAQEVREAAQREAQQLWESAERETAELREAAAREVAELRETGGREVERWQAEARKETDGLRASARSEVNEMVAAAEGRTQQLERSAETLWRERRRLIQDMRALGEQLVTIGEAEAKRFPRDAEAVPPVDEQAPTAVTEPVDAEEATRAY